MNNFFNIIDGQKIRRLIKVMSFLLKLYLLDGIRSSNDSIQNIETAFLFKLVELHVLLNINSLIKSKKLLLNSAVK